MKKLKPLLWLLLIPVHGIIWMLLVYLGLKIDTPAPNPDVVGHGVPIFTALFGIIGGVLFIVAVIIALIFMIRGFAKGRKKAPEFHMEK